MHRTLLGGGLGLFYYHYDGLGSVVAITNDSKQVIETYEYDVFGAPVIWDMNSHQMIDASLVGNPYFFTGREYDVETGNYYYRARYYHPEIGRFMSPDPLKTSPLISTSTREGTDILRSMISFFGETMFDIQYIKNFLFINPSSAL
jgi:RHS repeat-associated protein